MVIIRNIKVVFIRGIDSGNHARDRGVVMQEQSWETANDAYCE